jgi:hypothetical protein
MLKFKKSEKGSVKMLDFFNTLNKLKEGTKTKYIQTDKKPSVEIKELYEKVINILANFAIETKKHPQNNKRNSFWTEELTENEIFQKIQKNVYVGGGSLSEIFINNYEGKPKDIDIFINYNNFEYSSYNKLIEVVLSILNKNFGKFEIKKREAWDNDNYDKTFKLEEILTGTFNDFSDIKVELIFVNQFNLIYDLSFREFYYNGNFIIATEKAMNDIKNETITINTVESPLSTLIRAQKFSKRYGYKIDEYTNQWLKKYLKIYYLDLDLLINVGQMEKTLYKIEKYKEEFDMDELIAELNAIILTQEEKYILRTIQYETGEMNVDYFRNFIERMKIIEKEKIDINKYYEIKIPKITSEMNKFKDYETNKKVNEETKQEIMQKIKHLEKTLRLKKIFINKDDFQKFYRSSKQEILVNLSKEFNVDLYRSIEMEQFFMVMENSIQKGKFEFKDTIFNMLSQWNGDDYFGELEEIEQNILSEKMYIKPTIQEYLFKNDNYCDYACLEFKYSETEKSITKKINYNKKENSINVNSQVFGYLINERRDYLLELLNKEIKPLQEEEPYKLSLVELDEETSDVVLENSLLSEDVIEIINNLNKPYKGANQTQQLISNKRQANATAWAVQTKNNLGILPSSQFMPNDTEDDEDLLF